MGFERDSRPDLFRSDAFRDLSRREFVASTAVLAGGIAILPSPIEAAPETAEPCALTINGIHHNLSLDPRVTLLDLVREHLHMTGTKKGCDHGQCGACTVLVNGERVNSCLTLAIACNGDRVTTIEGLGTPGDMHPMQTAFLERDGFQCGFCTSGQICSAVAMLDEARRGAPSAVTKDVAASKIELSEREIRERMSGNICRCGAYPNIVAAVRDVARINEKTEARR